jgi:hypothetical protein
MVLVVIWICFILSMIFSEELDQPHYLLFSGLMLYFTYIYNKIAPFKMTARKIVFFTIIPNLIFWYIGFVYNDFLSLTPISYELFVFLLFTYTYLLLYIFAEHA